MEKISPRTFLKNTTIIFYPKLELNINKELPKFYKQIIKLWSEIAYNEPITASTMYAQKIWYNKFIRIDNKSYRFNEMYKAGVEFVKDLYSENGQLLKWNDFQQRYNLPITKFFNWRQIIDSIPNKWKEQLSLDSGLSRNSGNTCQHLLDIPKQLNMEKMTSRQIHTIMIRAVFEKPTEITIENK